MYRTSLLVTLRILSGAAAFACCLQVGFAAPSNRAVDVSTATLSPEADQLVQAALDAEAAGDATQRAALLATAIKADPDFAPARWHSGQLKFAGQWRTPEEVSELVSTDPRWVGYRELRDSLGDAPEDHLALARYCREHGLEVEGRYHWAHVMLASPNNGEARAALGLERYKDGLYSHQLVAQFKQDEKDAASDQKQYGPLVTQLCRDATRGDAPAREAALAKIRELVDWRVIDPLEDAAAKACKKTPRLAEPLELAVVAALSKMPQHAATLRLLNHAVYSDLAAVRKAAAEGLRPRRQTDYVPLLMAALRAPIEVDVDVVATPDGTVRMAAETRQAGPDSSRVHTQSVNLETDGVMGYDRSRSNPAAVLNRNLAKAETIAADAQARADAANGEAEELNRRIDEALQTALVKDTGSTPELWWEEWQHENELQYATEAPVEHTYSEHTETYRYPQGPVFYPRAEQPKSNFERRPERRPPTAAELYGGRTIMEILFNRQGTGFYSCFIPGTPVWTPEGAKPIEQIRVGDLVLSQNPRTGEAAFRVVLETSLGKPTTVISLRIGNEAIGSTVGHRFWVNGRGWEMAKALQPSTQLHALGGAVELIGVEPAEKEACYNLLVDEFHTFFIGEAKILVHDKHCPQPVLARVPGSKATWLFDPPAPGAATFSVNR